MPMVDIDEAELVALRQNSSLLSSALSNPKAREQVLRGLKTAKPDLAIPELDAAAPVMEEMRVLTASMSDLKKQMDDDKIARADAEQRRALEARWGEGRTKAAKQGYVGESLQSLEKFMEDNGIASHEIAAAAFEKLHPPATPVNNTSGKFDFFANKGGDGEDKLMKQLWGGDSEGFLGNAIDQTLKEMRGLA